MVNIAHILVIFEIIFLALVLCLTAIYSIAILSHRRFYHPNNMFILNICFTIMASAIFFMTYILLGIFDSRRFIISDVCLIIYYAYCIASVQIPFAFVAFTTYRFCLILYHTRPFFRTNKWVILCIGGQWISEFVISSPLLFLSHDVSGVHFEYNFRKLTVESSAF